MIYKRVYTDSSGESHFSDLRADFNLMNYAPPAPPLFASNFNPALQYGFIRIPAGWFGDWHPVPRRQLQVYLEGEIEAQVSDGEIQRTGPGMVYLLEDASGKGHKSRVVGDKDALIFVVFLPEQE